MWIIAVVFVLVATTGIFAFQFTGFNIIVNGGSDYTEIPADPVLDSVPSPNTDGSVELSWSRPPQTQYFELFRMRGFGWFYLESVYYSTSYVDNNVGDGYTYKYKVVAVNPLGKSPDSNVVTVAIDLAEEEELVIIPPDTPTLKMIAGPSFTGEIHISWSSVSNADDYGVYCSNDGTSYDFLGKVYTSSYDDSIAEDGTYYYKVKAGNEAGYSGFSNVESVVVDIPDVPDVPDVPKVYAITYEIVDSGVEISVTWEEVDCDTYNLYRAIVSDTKDTGYELIEEDITSTSYSVVLTNDIAKYFYKVSAVNDLGESEQSNPTTINITDEGVDEPDDYTWLYVLLGVLGVLVIPVVILTRKKKII